MAGQYNDRMASEEDGIDELIEEFVWARALAEEKEEHERISTQRELQSRLKMPNALAERDLVILAEAEQSAGDTSGSFWRVESVNLLTYDGATEAWIAGFYAITGWWYVSADGDADLSETYTFHRSQEEAHATAQERLSAGD